MRELFEFKGYANLFDVHVLIEELGYVRIFEYSSPGPVPGQPTGPACRINYLFFQKNMKCSELSET